MVFICLEIWVVKYDWARLLNAEINKKCSDMTRFNNKADPHLPNLSVYLMVQAAIKSIIDTIGPAKRTKRLSLLYNSYRRRTPLLDQIIWQRNSGRDYKHSLMNKQIHWSHILGLATIRFLYAIIYTIVIQRYTKGASVKALQYIIGQIIWWYNPILQMPRVSPTSLI